MNHSTTQILVLSFLIASCSVSDIDRNPENAPETQSKEISMSICQECPSQVQVTMAEMHITMTIIQAQRNYRESLQQSDPLLWDKGEQFYEAAIDGSEFLSERVSSDEMLAINDVLDDLSQQRVGVHRDGVWDIELEEQVMKKVNRIFVRRHNTDV